MTPGAITAPLADSGSVPLELTVSMPARNSAEYIGAALASVLSQQDVAFEVIVVDDASEDGTAGVVRALNDPRIRLYCNPEQKGIGWCHNFSLKRSRAPYFAHVDSDDLVIRPNAFRKLLNCIRSDESLGLVHAHFIVVDRAGNARRNEAGSLLAYQQRTRQPGRNYRRALVVEGSVMNALRLFPVTALERVGGHDESLRYGIDYELALRIAEHYRISVVPEALYAARRHGENTTEFQFAGLRFWWQKWHLIRRLSQSGKISFGRDLFRAAVRELPQVLGLANLRRSLGEPMHRTRTRVRIWRRRKQQHAYRWLVRLCGRWPRRPRSLKHSDGSTASQRVAYYLWRYPGLSETFTRREIAALLAAGITLEVLAAARDPEVDRHPELQSLADGATYLDELSDEDRARCRRWFVRHRPLRYYRLLLYVILHRYGYYKTFNGDLDTFGEAVVLAGLLRERGITHVHSPWLSTSAFVASIAAELAGITCSAQARAHELHRHLQTVGLEERIRGTAWVLANSEYNLKHLHSRVDQLLQERIHLMYEGITPSDFPAVSLREDLRAGIRILCVARLVEEKGLLDLLRACDELNKRGIRVQCRLIGGPERPTYAAYEIELRKLHRRLGLGGSVTFSGSQPHREVMRAFQAADVFVLPCVMAANGGRDITPNSLLEAMAFGLPVVSTTVGAIPEIVTDGEEGLLVTPGDPKAIADAVESLAQSSALRRELAAGARAKVARRFDSARNTWVLIDLLRGVPGC